LNETSLKQKNKKIVLEASSKINLLITAYNRMVDELEVSAVKQSEREELGEKWQSKWPEIKTH
jgi:hypothetical protein